ncbi:MAG: HAD-IIA family hydrolase [Candidatus Methanodesulfokora sp.]|jgi:4-nitrophenyl phosphatase|nr:MAG: HAD family hydrolase [Candidatus Korarchaeota archaeon]
MKYDAYFIDMDGVIWVGNRIIGDAVKAINILHEKGKVLFLTNNSTKSRSSYVRALLNAGISWASEEHVVSSGYATALYLRRHYGKGKAYVVGESGLIEELISQGFEIASSEDCWKKVDFVVVGMDRKFSYEKLWSAMTAVRNGAIYVATNIDPTFPTEKGLAPGAGAMTAAISTGAGRGPDVIIGKPSRIIFDVAMEIAGTSNALVIGDRLDTDVKGAKSAGLKSLLVLTGVTKPDDLRKSEIKPDYVLDNLMDIFNLSIDF